MTEITKVDNSFMTSTMYKRKHADDEDTDTDTSKADPNVADDQSADGQTQVDNRPDDNPEETTFKKRYADLRSHSQKLLNAKEKELEEAKRQIDQLSRKEVKLPKTPEEIEKFRSEYPDVYDTFRTVAVSELNEQKKDIELQLNDIRKQHAENKRVAAEKKLLELHPDVEEIKASEEFHNWAAEQPKWVQDALYENEDDPVACARAIDLYKADAGLLVPKKRGRPADPNKEATRKVTNTSVVNEPREGNKGKIWSIKEINRLSPREYERNEADIDAAYREGRISE